MLFPYKLIDLTHTLQPSIPTWTGTCGFHQSIAHDYKAGESETQFRVMTINMHNGIGTHMDAPSHCIPGGKSIHEFNVEELCLPCVVVDVSEKIHARYRVSVEDIISFEKQYNKIPENSCVLIRTGWEQYWNSPEQYHNNHVFPTVSIEAAELLLERKVAALGIDTLSPDCPEYGFLVHQAFLSQGKILLENVANISNMPRVGGFVLVLPMRIKDGTEAPLRLVGLESI